MECLSECFLAYDNIVLIIQTLSERDRIPVRCVSKLLYDMVNGMCVDDSPLVLIKREVPLSFMRKLRACRRNKRTNFKKILTREVMLKGYIGAFKYLMETSGDLPIPYLKHIGWPQLDMMLLHARKYNLVPPSIDVAIAIKHIEYITGWLTTRINDKHVKMQIPTTMFVTISEWESEKALSLCDLMLQNECRSFAYTRDVVTMLKNNKEYLRKLLTLIPHTLAYDLVKNGHLADIKGDPVNDPVAYEISEALNKAAEIRAVEIAKLEMERAIYRKELAAREQEQAQRVAALCNAVKEVAVRELKGKKMKFMLTPNDILRINFNKKWTLKYVIVDDVYYVNRIGNVE